MAEAKLDAVLQRLARWLTPLAACFGRRRHARGLDRYVAGLLSDSPRKSMQAMLTRVAQAIEQQYQHLKTELGLDHFEGRSYPGWQHHAVISAVAYAFLQTERRLHTDRRRRLTTATPTFPVICGHVQDVFTALLFVTQPRYLRLMEQAQRFVQLRI